MERDFTSLLLQQILALLVLVALFLKGAFKNSWGVILILISCITLLFKSGIDIRDLIAMVNRYDGKLSISLLSTCMVLLALLKKIPTYLPKYFQPIKKTFKRYKEDFEKYLETLPKFFCSFERPDFTVFPATCENSLVLIRLATYNNNAFMTTWQTSASVLAESGFYFNDLKSVVVCYRCNREMNNESARRPQCTWHYWWCSMRALSQREIFNVNMSRRSGTQATDDEDQTITPRHLGHDDIFPGDGSAVESDDRLAINEGVRRESSSPVQAEEGDDDYSVNISDDVNINIRRPRLLDRLREEIPGINDETGLPIAVGGVPDPNDDAPSDEDHQE